MKRRAKQEAVGVSRERWWGLPRCVSGSQCDSGQEATPGDELAVGGAREEIKARTTVRLWF